MQLEAQAWGGGGGGEMWVMSEPVSYMRAKYEWWCKWRLHDALLLNSL